MAYEQDLPRRDDAGSLARRLLSQWFGSTLSDEELDGAKLLSSELVNNAVLHGAGRITLRAELDENRLRVEVIDEGHGFEHAVRRVPFEQLSGRGLAIVDEAASRWGIHEGTTHVWADIERQGPRLGQDAKPDD